MCVPLGCILILHPLGTTAPSAPFAPPTAPAPLHHPLHHTLCTTFTNVQGDVDTALDCDEFVEALLRIALSAWQDDQSVPAPWQKMRKVRS